MKITRFALLCLLVGSSVWAMSEDFEDGQWSGSSTSMKVPPKVIAEGGNHFLRITGSSGDKQAIPSSYPHRNRSTVTMTSHFSSMPIITPANMRQTYRAQMRISAKCPKGCSVFELFQDAPEGTGEYGSQNGNGPSARFTVVNGRTHFETRYKNETRVDLYSLGVSANAWHIYKLVAVWSHHPSEGRFEVYVDGQLKKTIAGRDVNMGPTTNRLPMVKFGLYGDYATGFADVDAINLGDMGGGDEGPMPPADPEQPPPPIMVQRPLPAPTNFRLMLK